MGRASRQKRERRAQGGLKVPRNVPSFLRADIAGIRLNKNRPKISDSLAELIQPFTDEDTTLQNFRGLLGAAVIAWNLSLLEGNFPEEARLLLEGADVSDREALESFVSELVLRKRQLFPDDERFVAGWEVAPRPGGRFFVTAASL